jgi:hypothetical protein
MSLTQRYVLTSPVAHARRSDAMVVRFSDSASLGEDGVSPALLLGVGWDDGLVTVHRAASGALLHSVVADAAAAEAAGAPHTSRGGLPVTCLRWCVGGLRLPRPPPSLFHPQPPHCLQAAALPNAGVAGGRQRWHAATH